MSEVLTPGYLWLEERIEEATDKNGGNITDLWGEYWIPDTASPENAYNAGLKKGKEDGIVDGIHTVINFLYNEKDRLGAVERFLNKWKESHK